jgi:hypothetical protein
MRFWAGYAVYFLELFAKRTGWATPFDAIISAYIDLDNRVKLPNYKVRQVLGGGRCHRLEKAALGCDGPRRSDTDGHRQRGR